MGVKNNFNFWVLIAAIIGSGVLLLLLFRVDETPAQPWSSSIEKALTLKARRESESQRALEAQLVDPNQAPAPIREAVKLGYHLLLNTHQYVPQHAEDRLACTHCHFAGGNTTGGVNGSIALVGVAAVYPKYNERGGQIEDLSMRINSCFARSMNGTPLPLDSKEMLAIVTYLTWISKGTPLYQNVPWLGLPRLKSTHVPDPDNGRKVYAIYCATCHREEGEGERNNHIPPLWGPYSFNDGAGMNVEGTFASFTYYNMPYQEAILLTVEQALDVAAFVVRQPRPHYMPPETSHR